MPSFPTLLGLLILHIRLFPPQVSNNQLSRLRSVTDERTTSQLDERRAMQAEVSRLRKLHADSEAVRSLSCSVHLGH
jgi:hypothetical protein